MYPSTQSVAPRPAASSPAASSLSAPHNNQRKSGTQASRTTEITLGIVRMRLRVSGTSPGYGDQGLQTGDAALCSRVGAGAVAGVQALDRVRDTGTVAMRGHDVDLVTAPAQLLDPLGIEVVFDRHPTGVGIDGETGCGDRGLRIIAVDEHP